MNKHQENGSHHPVIHMTMNFKPNFLQYNYADHWNIDHQHSLNIDIFTSILTYICLNCNYTPIMGYTGSNISICGIQTWCVWGSWVEKQIRVNPVWNHSLLQCHSHLWLGDKRTKAATHSGLEGWLTFAPWSMTATLDNRECLWAHVCRKGEITTRLILIYTQRPDLLEKQSSW